MLATSDGQLDGALSVLAHVSGADSEIVMVDRGLCRESDQPCFMVHRRFGGMVDRGPDYAYPL